MEQIDVIRGVTAEMGRLAGLQGNCGRVIDRFLKRAIDGQELDVRVETPREWHLLDLACFVSTMQGAIAERAGHENTSEEMAQHLKALEVFPWKSTRKVSYVVRVEKVPASTSERKAMLKSIQQALDLVADLQQGWLEPAAGWGLREWYLGAGFEVTGDALSAFSEVVEGVYTRLEKLTPKMIALAAVLNSEVRRAAPGIDCRVVPAGLDAWDEAAG